MVYSVSTRIMAILQLVVLAGVISGCYKTWTLDYGLDRGLDSGPHKVPYAHASVCIAWLLLRLYCVYQLAIPSNNVDRRAPAPYSAMEVILSSDNSDSDSNLSIYDTSDLPKVFTPTKKPPQSPAPSSR